MTSLKPTPLGADSLGGLKNLATRSKAFAIKPLFGVSRIAIIRVMKIATLSDIHIVKNNDDASKTFELFTDSVIKEHVDDVYLLGDI